MIKLNKFAKRVFNRKKTEQIPEITPENNAKLLELFRLQTEKEKQKKNQEEKEKEIKRKKIEQIE